MLHARCNTLRRTHQTGARCSSHASRRVITAVQGSAAQLESIGAAQVYERNPKLQAALDDLFADTVKKGRSRVPKEETSQHVERIEQLGVQLGLNRIVPQWNDGAFRSLVTNTTDGVSDGDKCTLARLTFGKVGPADLMVQLDQVDTARLEEAPEQLKGPIANVAQDPPHGYAIVSYLKILSNGVFGRNSVKAVYELDEQDPSKLYFTVYGILLEPGSRDPQSLALWREALAEANPSMAPKGSIHVDIEFPYKAAIRYILMEPDFNVAVSVGTGGAYVMKRLQAAV